MFSQPSRTKQFSGVKCSLRRCWGGVIISRSTKNTVHSMQIKYSAKFVTHFQAHVSRNAEMTHCTRFHRPVHIYILDILHKQWKPGRTQNPRTRVFTINKDSKACEDHFDQVQEQLETLTSIDNLLSCTLHHLFSLFL